MIDLDPPSSNGVDLLYGHEYVLNRTRRSHGESRTSHLYAYTDNNPVNRIDPSGLDWLDDITDNALISGCMLATDPSIQVNTGNVVNLPANTSPVMSIAWRTLISSCEVIVAGTGGGTYNARDVLPFPKMW